nr:MAG TPA: hypothetical protein [Caudoviricetes sp.]
MFENIYTLAEWVLNNQKTALNGVKGDFSSNRHWISLCLLY